MPGPWDSAGKRLLRETPQHIVSWLLKGATLILLAKGGTEPDVVREMVTDLTEARELELLALAYTFGGLASGSEAYESWFKRSFAMLDDILEESWTYQEIVKKGMEKGMRQGLEQGLEQGRAEERQHVIREQRETLLNFVQKHFPELTTFAEVHVENIKDTDALQHLLNQLLFTVQTAEEAKQAIVDASAEEIEE